MIRSNALNGKDRIVLMKLFLSFLTKALPTDGPTDGQTHGRTRSYRDARTRLKNRPRQLVCVILTVGLHIHKNSFYLYLNFFPHSPLPSNSPTQKNNQIMESLSSSTNELEMDDDFRLWLSTKPDDRIPVPILQASHKVAIEEPAGLKAQLLKVNITMSNSRKSVTRSAVPSASLV